jgi:hypothetical protein
MVPSEFRDWCGATIDEYSPGTIGLTLAEGKFVLASVLIRKSLAF